MLLIYGMPFDDVFLYFMLALYITDLLLWEFICTSQAGACLDSKSEKGSGGTQQLTLEVLCQHKLWRSVLRWGHLDQRRTMRFGPQLGSSAIVPQIDSTR